MAAAELEDGPVRLDALRLDALRLVDSAPGRVLVEVVLHEGREHVVRRLIEEVRYPVSRLVPLAIGPVRLGDLKPGRTRRLDRGKIAALSKAVGE